MNEKNILDCDNELVTLNNMTKIYESPDNGKTIYQRDFGADPLTRTVVKTSVQQQWNITFNGEKVDL